MMMSLSLPCAVSCAGYLQARRCLVWDMGGGSSKKAAPPAPAHDPPAAPANAGPGSPSPNVPSRKLSDAQKQTTPARGGSNRGAPSSPQTLPPPERPTKREMSDDVDSGQALSLFFQVRDIKANTTRDGTTKKHHITPGPRHAAHPQNSSRGGEWHHEVPDAWREWPCTELSLVKTRPRHSVHALSHRAPRCAAELRDPDVPTKRGAINILAKDSPRHVFSSHAWHAFLTSVPTPRLCRYFCRLSRPRRPTGGSRSRRETR